MGARKEKASLFVPVSSPVASVFDSEAKVLMEKFGCRGLHFDPRICNILDNKHTFCEWARSELGLRTPESFLLTSNADVRNLNAKLQKEAEAGSKQKFVLKNLQYDAIHRLDLFTLPCSPDDLNAYLRNLTNEFAITATQPWQAQRWLAGQEYAAFAVLRLPRREPRRLRPGRDAATRAQCRQQAYLLVLQRVLQGLDSEILWKIRGRLDRIHADAHHGARRAVHDVRPLSFHSYELGADSDAPRRRDGPGGGMEKGGLRNRKGR